MALALTVDVAGISHAYGGALSALSITYTLTPLSGGHAGDEKKWKEREVVTALYIDREVVLADDTREFVGELY